MRRATSLLLVIASASLALSGRMPPAQDARFIITPATVLIDERFSVALEGLKPDQDVTIRLDAARSGWQSSATFRSDARGHVDVPDPMRLIWSATGERPTPGGAALAPAATQPWTFTAESQ